MTIAVRHYKKSECVFARACLYTRNRVAVRRHYEKLCVECVSEVFAV